VLKKNRSVRNLSAMLGVSRNQLSQSPSQESRKPRSDKTSPATIKCIQDYYLRDTCSRLTTGKKQTKTNNGIKEQIRFLTDSIHNLWLMFDSEYPELAVSRTVFYNFRPFYVLQPRLSDREQCGCIKCCNLQVIDRFY
jgi:hypothetical protein